jgi:hypothetical protein
VGGPCSGERVPCSTPARSELVIVTDTSGVLEGGVASAWHHLSYSANTGWSYSDFSSLFNYSRGRLSIDS